MIYLLYRHPVALVTFKEFKICPASVTKTGLLNLLPSQTRRCIGHPEPSPVLLTEKIGVIQNRAVRFITPSYSREITIAAPKTSLGIASLATCRTVSCLCFLHCFYCHPSYAPPHFQNCLTASHPDYIIHTVSNVFPVTPYPSTAPFS